MQQTSEDPRCAAAGPVQVRLCPVPKDGTAITVRVVGPCISLLQHWSKRDQYACPGEEHCPQVVHRLSTAWKGYAAAELWCDRPDCYWRPCVLEITECMWEVMHPTPIRGSVWLFQRPNAERKLREVTTQLIDQVDPRNLREDIDTAGLVYRVYRTTKIEWNPKPLFARRQILAATVDKAPPTALPPVDPRDVPGTPEWKAARDAERDNVRAALKAAQLGPYAPKGGGK